MDRRAQMPNGIRPGAARPSGSPRGPRTVSPAEGGLVGPLTEGISCRPLCGRTLKAASDLACRVFAYIDPSGPFREPALDFEASLSRAAFARRTADPTQDPERLRYWVATQEDGRVVGTIGLYVLPATAPGGGADTCWLGWMCVDPSVQGRGIGKGLLDAAISQARAEGFSTLRLYTSDHPSEAAAQGLYEDRGLRIYARAPAALEGYELLYRELDLTAPRPPAGDGFGCA